MDYANCINPQLAVIETVVNLLQRRTLENSDGVLKRQVVPREIPPTLARIPSVDDQAA
jgi:hypothetical protein